jgi:ATP-dependent Clp protease protease subunit
MIHQPLGGFQGQATDIEIHAREVGRMKKLLNEILSERSGKSIQELEKDSDRDFFMSSDEAKEYGLIDDVIVKRG